MDGTQVGFYGREPSDQWPVINDPSGSVADTDVEARAAIEEIIDALQNIGIVEI